MIVVPAVDLLDGACVQLQGGDPDDVKVRLPDPVAEARRWAALGAPWIHVVDLDRALGRGSNVDVVHALARAVPAKVQAGGGVRSLDDAQALLEAGVARVVAGTRAVKDPAFLREAADRLGERLVVAVDARGDEVVVKGWTEGSGRSVVDLCREAADVGVGALLYTDVGREGALGGANVEGVRRLVEAVDVPVLASGGVAGEEDIERLAEAGAWGVVVGMAAYTGRIDMKRAIERWR